MAVHVHDGPVQIFDLDVVFVDSDLQLLHNLLDGDLLALEDLDLCVELGDLGFHGALLLHHLLLLPGDPLDVLLQLHHGGLVLRSRKKSMAFFILTK